MRANNLCQHLDWDSAFWRRRIARSIAHRLDEETMREMLVWCEAQAINCLYLLADADDETTVRLAETNHFRFADIRLTLERALADIPPAEDWNISFAGGEESGPLIRLSTEEDVARLRAIARASHRDSRFYFDANFPAPLCDLLYETWIEKSCRGYADAVLVAERLGEASGYISCHLSDEATGEIGLLGVEARAQGEGLGQYLVEAALRWFAARGMERVTVVTQGRNSRAQRLYQKCGFRTQSVRLWYHLWLTGPESSAAYERDKDSL